MPNDEGYVDYTYLKFYQNIWWKFEMESVILVASPEIKAFETYIFIILDRKVSLIEKIMNFWTRLKIFLLPIWYQNIEDDKGISVG